MRAQCIPFICLYLHYFLLPWTLHGAASHRTTPFLAAFSLACMHNSEFGRETSHRHDNLNPEQRSTGTGRSLTETGEDTS